jgi:SAM-dependent methyltransferase
MLAIQNIRNRSLVRAAWKTVRRHMKEMNTFIPDRNWILSLLLPEAPASILDIGPNVYVFTKLLSKEKTARYSYTAMDIVKRYDDPSVKEVVHDACIGPYPFPDASFDLIIASDVIEHLPDTDVFLREISRLLKPDGRFFCTTPNYASLFCIVKVLRGKMLHDPLGKESERYCFREHFKYFTHRDMIPYLGHFGLYPDTVIAHDLKTDIDYALKNGIKGRIAMRVFNLVSRMSLRFSPEIVLIASKTPGPRTIIRL